MRVVRSTRILRPPLCTHYASTPPTLPHLLSRAFVKEQVHHMRIHADQHPTCGPPGEHVVAVNSDGIDVDSSSNVLIEHVYIQASDDVRTVDTAFNKNKSVGTHERIEHQTNKHHSMPSQAVPSTFQLNLSCAHHSLK